MIIVIFLGFFGFLLGIVGLCCINIGGLEFFRKVKLVVIVGVFYILVGICGMVVIFWYVFNIIWDFFDFLYFGIKYELGFVFYLGWSVFFIFILGGFCFCFICCCGFYEDFVVSVWLFY